MRTVVTLVCDSCGTDIDVKTRALGTLEGEACPDCWKQIAELTTSWRGPKRKRKTA